MHRVGIVGVSRGKRFVSSFEAHPDMKVTALCDLDSKLLSEVGAAFELPDSRLFQDYDAFLEADMDIVMIATPIPLHTEQTIKVVKSIEMTVPGLVAHESAMKGGVWLDVPQFEW